MSTVIKRAGKIKARGFDPDHPGLAIIEIPLNKEPDPEWINCFERPSKWTPSIHPPRVEGKFIVWRADKDRVDKNIKWIFDYIDQANTCYERALEKKQKKEERLQKQKRLKEKELEEIESKLENL